jgi:hypothetical protein
MINMISSPMPVTNKAQNTNVRTQTRPQADRPTVKKSNQLQLHSPQTRARRSHGKQVPHQNDPADYDGRTNHEEGRPKRTARGGEQQQQHDADNERN